MRTRHLRARLLLAVSLMASVALLGGCASTQMGTVASRATDVATELPTKLRFETETSTFPEFATLEEASGQVGITLKTPKSKVGKLEKVVVRDKRAGEMLPKELRSADLHYTDCTVIEYPYKDEAEAQQNFSRFPGERDAKYYSAVTVSGFDGWRWDTVNEPMIEHADGTTTRGMYLPGNSVLWRDGRMVYHITSDSIASKDLIVIAESMY